MNDIFVTNKNDFHHTDFYNGKQYDFPKGERVLVPVEAARHMFGLGLVDKGENLIRLGWANKEEGVTWLANFVFTQAVLVEQPFVEETASAEATA